ncbi:MAG: FG-GAP repeat domain-containing protein, partial [Terriglobia bacterium]
MLTLLGASLAPYPRAFSSPQIQPKAAELNNNSVLPNPRAPQAAPLHPGPQGKGGLPSAAALRDAKIRFSLASIPFQLETDETPNRHAPATMAGGVAVFDYNKDGRPDIFFTNGANIQTLKKDAPKYSNRLFRNDGHGVFTDVTAQAGLAGAGYDMGAAVGDYDNDGYPDLFVAGVHRNTLYHNNGDGTFTDVTKKAGLDKWNDPEYGPLWAVAAAWVDVNNDGRLDLVVINYMQWTYSNKPLCVIDGISEYCH